MLYSLVSQTHTQPSLSYCYSVHMCEGHRRRPLSHHGQRVCVCLCVCVSVCVWACPCVHVRGGRRCQGDAMVTRCQPTSWRRLSRSGSAFVLHSWWQAAPMPPSAANWTRQQKRWDCRSVWWLSVPPYRSLGFVCVCARVCVEESERKRRQRVAAGWKDGVDRLEAMNYIWTQSVLRAARAHSSSKLLTQLTTHTRAHTRAHVHVHTHALSQRGGQNKPPTKK